MNAKEVLKQQFMAIVNNQLREGEPPETALALQRLVGEGYAEADARAMIAQCVAVEIYQVMQNEEPFNLARYLRNLSNLPQTPEES
ncbi:MAG: hypothetical protein KDC66_24135 [Phaeodactylibacter sp.]|nr:hypothetical protein [Phaeodactylibacter sp.]MCB9275554.1 hypothetical protein [Lewinellaceae bacterium]